MPDAAPLQQNTAHSNEDILFNRARLKGAVVAHGYVIADQRRHRLVGVQDTVVLYTAAVANHDPVEISPKNRPPTNACLVLDDHVTDQYGGRRNVGGRRHLGFLAIELDK